MTTMRKKQGGRVPRVALALAALALLVWGAAVVAMAGGGGEARAEGQIEFVDEHLVIAVEWNGEWYYVQFQMLIKNDGPAALAAAVAAARADFIGRFPGAVEVVESEVSAQYVLNGYWWAERTASWGYNPAGKPETLSGDQQAAGSGASAWNTTGANFAFAGGGGSGNGTGACGGGLDGANTAGWAPQSGSVLAVTCTWFNQSGNPKPAIEFDMQFDPEWNWTTGSPVQVDFASVAAHEFGHALGLGHSASGSAVMYASYSQGSIKQSPTGDDVAGILAIYGPVGGEPTPTSTPTNTPTATPSGTPGGTPSATPSGTPSGTPSATPSGTPSATATPTKTPTKTPTPTSTIPGGSTPPGGSPPTWPPTSPPASTPTPPLPPTATKTATPSPTPTGTPKPILPLLPGANLMAWPGADAPPAVALAGQAGIQAVYSYNPATKAWSRYIPSTPAFVNNLAVLKQGQAYWFISSSALQIPYVP